MIRTVDALDLWLARLSPSHGCVRWASQALAMRFPQWTAGLPLAELTAAFPGLADAIGPDVADGPAAPATHDLTAPDGSALRATVGRLPGGEIAVLLGDGVAQARASARHLGDRERLLFLSRSLSVGEMASTLAHELNQPIGSIVNLLRGLSMRLERGVADPKVLGPAVVQGIDQALYAAGILARVREYVQPRRPHREPICLPTLVAAAIALLDWEIERDAIRVELLDRSGVPAPTVLGDPVMLQQVIVNLARNAIEAMRGVPVAERLLRVVTALEDDSIVLRIADGGCGIDAQAADRLFTPFFTTKPDGTGLGLHVCRSIVELHEGRLWFEPRQDRGCTVSVALPVLAREPSR